MDRKPKATKTPGFAREILSTNLLKLLEHHYQSRPNITQRQKALEEASGVKFSTIQRICDKAVGANLETLEQIALAFDLSLYHLFISNLDASNPQIVKGADKAEQQLYLRFNRTQRGELPVRLAHANRTPAGLVRMSDDSLHSRHSRLKPRHKP